MGEVTAVHLATKCNYTVFAGCYLKESFKKYEHMSNVIPVQIDVSDENSVENARKFVEDYVNNPDNKIKGFYGLLLCAGIAYIAPFEYIPMKAFKRQIDVNYYGYVYLTKAFLPLMKKSVLRPNARRGRICFVSSGPLPGPGVPFITSYLGAKWAGDALIQGLRMEMRLRQLPIDCVILSPGIVKPTRLTEEGELLLQKTFDEMPPEAKDEYMEMIQAFRKYQIEEPGTHVSVVGQQMECLMRHGKPHLRYFVGPDAVAATIVGILPTGLREHLLRNSLMMHYKKIPRFFFK